MIRSDPMAPEYHVERLRDGRWRHVGAYASTFDAAREFDRLRERYGNGIRVCEVSPIKVAHNGRLLTRL